MNRLLHRLLLALLYVAAVAAGPCRRALPVDSIDLICVDADGRVFHCVR